MRFFLIFLTFLTLNFAEDRFDTNSQDVVIEDSRYNLMWQDSYSDNSVKKLKWQDAIDYCESLTLGGYNDWRLPNFNELYNLANRNYYNPSIDKVFKYTEPHFYWTSTTYAEDKKIAWLVNFNSGDDGWDVKKYRYYVRCVRDLN